MAIQSNSSEVQIAGGGIPLYTGIAPVSVIAVNPSLAELHALDINLKTEPNYTGIQLGDNVKNKLTFWLKAEVKLLNGLRETVYVALTQAKRLLSTLPRLGLTYPTMVNVLSILSMRSLRVMSQSLELW